MKNDEAYQKARRKLEQARLSKTTKLSLGQIGLKILPESLIQFTYLNWLSLRDNYLTTLPESLGQLTQLRTLNLRNNKLTTLPESIGELTQLIVLYLNGNQLVALPESIGQLTKLQSLNLENNNLTDLPLSLARLNNLTTLSLNYNPLNPELAAASKEGLEAVMRFLRAKSEAQVVLNEAKLILVGEGAVGKSCLLDALRGDPWMEHQSTHGIEIKPVIVTAPDSQKEIITNGWDFGGQKIYRPTHQLFFSAPAVYLVVWKPREGTQQNLVKEWITLVKHREPDAKILVVATHGGPRQRQPDIDRQELWDLFGKETVVNFFSVDNKPDENGQRHGIEELKHAIARIAVSLPEVGRSVPQSWQQAREDLKQSESAYLPLKEVCDLCHRRGMDADEARLFVRIYNRLGHLTHYEHDPALQDIVILKPDWLATAISFALDDEYTRTNLGLVTFERLCQLWNDSERDKEYRYEPRLHRLFLRLMERFDISYKVALPSDVNSEHGYWQHVSNTFDRSSPIYTATDLRYTSLIAQLVPDVRPTAKLQKVWADQPTDGEMQQVQICRILDNKGDTATAEGLFYQLIVRLHKFSLGRLNFNQSVHWQRGLILDNDYNGRALLEHIGNDVRITVRAAYPERFLSHLTQEVSWLVENFWEGLRCPIMVPCLHVGNSGKACPGLYEVEKLIENKRRNRPEQPCPTCNEWQDIDSLLRNAPAARPSPTTALLTEFAEMKAELTQVRPLLIQQHKATIGRFDSLDVSTQRTLSKIDDAFSGLMRAMTDEAKEGPRLFSLIPIDPHFFDRPNWVSEKFQLTLWCEHSRLPLPQLNGGGSKIGIYELNIPREWFVKSTPFLKVLGTTLGLVLPVASAATKVALDEMAYKGIESQLDLGQKSIESVLKGSGQVEKWLTRQDAPEVGRGKEIEAQGAALRQLQIWLKEKDPTFGGLVRVQNKRQEFLWVHQQFVREY